MNRLLKALQGFAATAPERRALWDGQTALTYRQLWLELDKNDLRASTKATTGLMLDNGLPWVLCDLLALRSKRPTAPIPGFFTRQQKIHTIRQSGISRLLSDDSSQAEELLRLAWGGNVHSTPLDVAGQTIHASTAESAEAAELPTGTAKITYTSGTTGNPKGVCLCAKDLFDVAASVCERSGASTDDRHLCITPLSTLLENVAGVYAALLSGAQCVVPPLREVGLKGSSGFDPAILINALSRFSPSTLITTPQILELLVRVLESGSQLASAPRFVAVGGARVTEALLRRASQAGLRVYQGYGLSECASVVSLNGPGHERLGSVGRPLAHATVTLSTEGEILVSGARHLGYLGDHRPPPEPWPTGDLGRIDEQGFLYVAGRKRDVIITAYGRNFSPEWVEQELTNQPEIAQAVVFGEAKPWNTAILVVAPGTGSTPIADAVNRANQALPDYARVIRWLIADQPFLPGNGQLTVSGRPRREAILARYGQDIECLYQEEITV